MIPARQAEGRIPMTAALWLPPLIRALATALLVVLASVVAEAAGPFFGALVASLPVTSGPTYVFLSLQHGDDFIAAGALTSCAANAATGLFLIVYGGLMGRLSPWRCLAAAELAWCTAAAAVQPVPWTPWSVALLNLAVYGAGAVLTRRARVAESTPAAPARRRWFELPARAAVVAVFVTLVVAVSTVLGPRATGVVAAFPVGFSSLLAIVQARIGGRAAALLAISALPPMLGFGAMLLAFHLAVPPLGRWAALGVALLVSVLWSVAMLFLQPRPPATPRNGPSPQSAPGKSPVR